MRGWLLLLGLLVMPCVVFSKGADTACSAKPVAFDVHDGYFVSNRFEPDAATSFVVLKDQASFDKVFGVAMVMGDKSRRLPQGAFDKKVVVAAIHRGKAMVTFQVEDVTLAEQVLVVRYTTKSQASASAEFACPLIIAVDKAGFKGVRWIVNGKEVR